MLRTVTGTSLWFLNVTVSWRCWTSRPGLPAEPAPRATSHNSSQSTLPDLRSQRGTNTTNNTPDTTATTMPDTMPDMTPIMIWSAATLTMPVTIWSFILRTTASTTDAVRPPERPRHQAGPLPSPAPPRPSQAILAPLWRGYARE